MVVERTSVIRGASRPSVGESGWPAAASGFSTCSPRTTQITSFCLAANRRPRQTLRSMGSFCIRSVTESVSARSRGRNLSCAPSGSERDPDAMVHSTKILQPLKDGDMPSKSLIATVVAGLLLFALVFATRPSIGFAQVPEKNSTVKELTVKTSADGTDDPTNPLIPEFRRCDSDQ